MNRRSLLLGLGTLTVGSGAVLGSGAFTTVEAQRTVSVQTAGDDAALLQLTDATNGAYVTVDDGLAEIDIGSGSSGVNQSARTEFDVLIDISNEGTQDVTQITFEIQGDNGENELLTPIPENGYGGNSGDDFTGGDGSVLTPTDDPVTLGLAIELRDDQLNGSNIAAYDNGDIVAGNFDPTLRITADTDT